MPGPVTHGRFVWYDLMTTDPDGAADFYSQVAGWSSTPWEGAQGEDQSGPYMMWMAGENAIGGRAKLPEEAIEKGAPTHWLAYVTVPDTEAVAAKTEAAGGTVLMPPKTMEGVGTFAVLQDPQGAAFCPFTPADGPGGEVAIPTEGSFSWHELYTSDLDAAFAFYSEVFGWEKTDAMDMGEMGIYQMFGPEAGDQFAYGGMMKQPAEMPGPPAWLYYIMVPDINSAAEKVKELGGQVFNGPMEVPGGDMIAMCFDPQGGAFALHAKSGG